MAIETPARIAILGAGPIGLEAALYARYLGYAVEIYERGRVAENVRRWGHVRMFTPFGKSRSSLGMAALRAQDPRWQPPPDNALLTGAEFAERYLVPLSQSDLLVDGLHERTEVLAIGRDWLLKGEGAGDEARGEAEFRVLLRSTDRAGHACEQVATADAVIDASGTYGCHNWLGPGGIPAIGELAAEPHVEYGLPDVMRSEHARYAGRNILLLGDGDSAATNLVALAELAAQSPDMWITWVTRGRADGLTEPVCNVPDDPLPERQRIRRLANRLAADDGNHITHLDATRVESLAWHADLDRFVVQLSGRHPGELEFDRVIANVGFHANTSLSGELQLDACPLTGAPRTTAGHPGAAAIITTEPDFYVLGAKSRGRDARFLISDGLDQIRALFAVMGDRAALDLYATMP